MKPSRLRRAWHHARRMKRSHDWMGGGYLALSILELAVYVLAAGASIIILITSITWLTFGVTWWTKGAAEALRRDRGTAE